MTRPTLACACGVLALLAACEGGEPSAAPPSKAAGVAPAAPAAPQVAPLPPSPAAGVSPAAPGAPQPPAVLQLPLRMVGTEPFWGGLITDAELTLEGVDRRPLRLPITERRGDAERARITAESGSGETYATLSVTLVREPCSDGMSDRTYFYRADVLVGGAAGTETLRGCAGPPSMFQPQN